MRARHDLPMYYRRPTGFTLLELLVIIGMIVILVSTLMPSLQQARASAQQSHCMAKLRDIHRAAMGYAQQNEFVLPDMNTFDDLLLEYDLTDESYLCPAGSLETTVTTTRRLHYGYNHYGYGGGCTSAECYASFDPDYSGADGVGVPRVQAVADHTVIFMADAEEDTSPHDIGGNSRTQDDWPLQSSFDSHAYTRHAGQYNGLSLDGSVSGYEGWKPLNENWYIRKKWAN